MDLSPDVGGPVPMVVGPVAGTVVGAGAGVVPMDVGVPVVGTGASGAAVPVQVGPGPEAMEVD